MENSPMNSDFYSEKEFWNDRFEKTEGYFDWYIGWKELKQYIVSLIKISDKFLMVGCGNSQMSELMYKDGYENIINIDISDVVIEKMKNTYKEVIEMDATNMEFHNNTFDFIIDKGTLDAMLCSKNFELPIKLIQEMYRTIKEGSSFIIITYGRPDERLEIFEEALEGKAYELESKKVSLSLMSNFINILRNNSSDFTVTQAVKDKDVLTASVLEACILKLKMEKENLKETEGKDVELKIEKIDKKLIQLKLLKMLHDTKRNKDLKKLQEKSDSNSEEKINDDNLDISATNNQEKPSEMKNDSDQNSRRSHCYIYIFKKLTA